MQTPTLPPHSKETHSNPKCHHAGMEGLNSKPGIVSVFQKYKENRLSFQPLLLLLPSLIPLFSAELVVRINMIKNIFGSKFPDLNLLVALTKAMCHWTGGGHCPLALLWLLDFDVLEIKGCFRGCRGVPCHQYWWPPSGPWQH